MFSYLEWSWIWSFWLESLMNASGLEYIHLFTGGYSYETFWSLLPPSMIWIFLSLLTIFLFIEHLLFSWVFQLHRVEQMFFALMTLFIFLFLFFVFMYFLLPGPYPYYDLVSWWLAFLLKRINFERTLPQIYWDIIDT